MERACLKCCVTLLDHPLEYSHHESTLVSATAVLGVDTRQKNWLSGENYTPRLSAIIKLARMMVALDTSHGHTNLRTPSLTEQQDRVDRFMTSGISTPMQWIMMLRGHGMSIQFDSTILVTMHRNTTFSTTAMMRYRSKETHGCSNAFATIRLCGAGTEGFLEKGVEKWKLVDRRLGFQGELERRGNRS